MHLNKSADSSERKSWRITVAVITLLLLASACQLSEYLKNPIVSIMTVTPRVTRYSSPMKPITNVQLAWFYKPPKNQAALDFIARNYQFFILTKIDETERDFIRSFGKDALQYILFNGIENPGSCSLPPMHNQVADAIGDYCSIDQQHPDWFMLDRFGNRILIGGDPMMDPANPGWQAYFLNWVRQSHQLFGWNGVFLDNVEASLNKITRQRSSPVLYPDDVLFQNAVEGFLKYLYTNYFKPQNQPLMANIIEVKDAEVWLRYLNYLDGAMLEAFAVDWSSGYLTVEEWQAQLQMVIAAQQMGKQVILVAQGNNLDFNREQFAFASYLLVNEGKAFFRYSNDLAYDQIWNYDNYAVNLGAPLGPCYQEGGSWQRDFSNGVVKVNPGKHSAIISINS
jgi:hypothetical protein